MAVAHNDEVKDVFLKADGKLPVEDESTYKEIIKELIVSWDIKRAPELMLVNRLVSTWMKMKRVEKMLSKYDLFFERKDAEGNVININMNQIAYYLKSLEADFRSYYKVLEARNEATGTKELDFHDFINVESKVKKKKKKKQLVV